MTPRSSLLLALLAGSAAALLPAAASAQSAPVEDIVGAMRTLSGNQKARPSGAKGQCYTGTFTPAAEARALSASAMFAKPVPVVARFSVGSGNPRVADTSKAVNRGFSFRIDPDGPGRTEFVMVNAPINFVKSPEQMLAFLQARLPGADGKPDAARIKAFTDANPETTLQGRYLASQPVPASWVGVSYWGIHGYSLVAADGTRRLVKFRMVPKAGALGLTDDEAKAKPADFLADELAARLKAGQPAGFQMVAFLGRPGDEAIPVTQQWADEDSRPTVTLGSLDIRAVEANATCDGATFDPTVLADGVAGPANDPLFEQRSPAYAISITQRF
jgi:catalase